MSDILDQPTVIVPLRRERNTVLVSLPKIIRDALGITTRGYVYLRVKRRGVLELTPVEERRVNPPDPKRVA